VWNDIKYAKNFFFLCVTFFCLRLKKLSIEIFVLLALHALIYMYVNMNACELIIKIIKSQFHNDEQDLITQSYVLIIKIKKIKKMYGV
jgi:hypothetical protein